MRVYRLRSFDDFNRFQVSTRKALETHLREIDARKPESDRPFTVPGYSYTAGEAVDFDCDFQWGPGFPGMNWREQIRCPKTYFNNRMRASIHVADLFLDLYDESRIYLMEQTTPLYRYYHDRFAHVLGSEFLGDKVPRGETDERGLRNEDATRLTFPDKSIDAIMSFDVFEHIPDFKAAFSECFRVLSDNGRMLFSAPFIESSALNSIRAVVEADGEVRHLLLPPEYHGDPVGNGSILCFQHFGWEVLKNLRDAGFADAYALAFWSTEMGYYTRQYQFIAEKRP